MGRKFLNGDPKACDPGGVVGREIADMESGLLDASGKTFAEHCDGVRIVWIIRFRDEMHSPIPPSCEH